METKRVQLDLSESEHAEMELLMVHSGLKTKREFVSNALTLFGWAAREILGGRKIAAVSGDGRVVKELAMPCLTPFAAAADELTRLRPSREEIMARVARGGKPVENFLSDLEAALKEPVDVPKELHPVG